MYLECGTFPTPQYLYHIVMESILHSCVIASLISTVSCVHVCCSLSLLTCLRQHQPTSAIVEGLHSVNEIADLGRFLALKHNLPYQPLGMARCLSSQEEGIPLTERIHLGDFDLHYHRLLRNRMAKANILD